MATNEQEVPEEPTATERYIHTVTRVVSKATDTGPSTGVSLRVWVIVALLGAIISTALVPLNVVGTVLVVALALTLGSRSRGPR